jgi:lysozyme
MPNMNIGTSPSRELRRLTQRLNAALGRRARPRAAAPPQPRVRRAAARGAVAIRPGLRVGPVGRLLVRILEHYPKRGLTITSAYRPGPRSHHRGLVYGNSPTAAVDLITNQGAAGMRDVAKWLYDRFAADTVELIHTTPFSTDRGFYVKNQKKYPGGGPYSAQTRREHRDHVHFASSKGLAQRILARLGAKAPAAVRSARAASAAARPRAAAGGMRLSKRGAQLIAEFEDVRQKLYDDPAGHCTIGIGHLVHRGRCNGSEPAEFKRGISRERAYQLLQQDARRMEAAVNRLGVPLNQNQFDALVSFTYNLGPAWTVEKTGIRDALKARRYRDVPREMKKWVKAGSQTLPGLVRRRNAEAKLFSTPAGPKPQPGPRVVNPADVRPGKRNNSVLTVQQALAKAVGLDFSSGPGHFGPRTLKAYAAWQRKCGLPPETATGRPDLASLKKLGAQYRFTVRGVQAPPAGTRAVPSAAHELVTH